MPLGAHMSIAGGLDAAVRSGHELGCETIQIFTRSPRQWRPRPLEDEEIERFHASKAESGIDPVFAHDSYLINLASPDEQLWRKSVKVFIEEMGHCRDLGLPYLVVHPGSHVGTGEEAGLRRVASALDRARRETEGYGVQVLLENTAGQGTNLGHTFEHLSRLLDQVLDHSWLGICFDTCHAFAAGHELRTPEAYEAAWQELDERVGLGRLKVLHLNDTKGGLGSGLDRHEHIGQGQMGLEPFRMLLNDPRFEGVPMVLETPKNAGSQSDKENLQVLRSLISAACAERAGPD